MPSYEDKIKELENLISNTKYNKSTQHAIGLYKAQLAKLKEKEESRGKGKGKTEGYAVRKTGDGTVLLLGFPSVGKSTLLNAITNANSEIGAYDFTTLKCIPGLMEYKFAKIQVLDVPGVVRGAASGRGRGKEVLAVMRNADLALVIIDASSPGQYDTLMKEVNESGIRLNEHRPHVRITKTAKDGINIGKTCRLPMLDDETIKTILKTFRINNANVLIRETITDDQLIDCIEDNKKYLPAITVLNKIDMISKEEADKIKSKIPIDISISAKNADHLDELRELIFEKLNFIRLYMKEPRKPADMKEPMIMFRDSTTYDLCNKLHRDFVDKFKFVRIWGPSAKFPGQRLTTLKHAFKDKDIVELHIR
ncbi:MAG: GTP-binding protein [Nanoarchaeota archaeon]|nr:GTP-binding protein [Nanoarchaeota archaeon]